MAENVVTVVESAPGVAVITLNRPEKRNALWAEAKRALTGAAPTLEQTQVLLNVNDPETSAPQAAVLERLVQK